MRIHVDKRKWYWTIGIVNGVLLVLAIVCACVMAWITGRLDSLDAADRWRGNNEMKFAQVACFLPVDEAKTQEDIWQFRRTLDQKLVEASLTAPEGGSLYRDAWSASGKVKVEAEHGKADVQAIGVGGDFFLFHPLDLRCGMYLKESDLMQDRVILDEELAWQLFGGWDVAGMTVTINGKPFNVAGVIHREDDFASTKAYQDGPGLFMSFDALQKLTEHNISTYEIVLPNMISGFGFNLVKENFPVGGGVLVENSRRYGLKNLFRVIGDFGQRSMGRSGVIYPYWENAVRMTEDYLAMLLVLVLLFVLIPVLTALVLVIGSITKTGRYVKKKVPAMADSMVEKHREARYEKMTHQDEEIDILEDILE